MVLTDWPDATALRHTRRRFIQVVGLTGIELALASCQASGTRPIIKIGLSAPFSGFDESAGYSVIGAVRLAVREHNQSGGVSGHSVELVALDDANEPDTAAQRAGEMIIDPAVMAVLGGFDSPVAAVTAATCERAGLPFLALSAAGALSGHAFRLIASSTEAGQWAGAVATRDMGTHRIAVISDHTTGESNLAAAFVAAAQAGGATIVCTGNVERWQLDFSAISHDLAAATPDLIFFAGRAAEAGELLKQMRGAGIAAAFLGGPGTDDARLSQIAGQAAQGASYISLGFALAQVDDPRTRDNLAAACLRPAGAQTVVAYDATRLVLNALEHAIRASGKPTRAAMTQALRTSRFQGISGEISFDQQGNRRRSPIGLYRLVNSYPGDLVL